MWQPVSYYKIILDYDSPQMMLTEKILALGTGSFVNGTLEKFIYKELINSGYHELTGHVSHSIRCSIKNLIF